MMGGGGRRIPFPQRDDDEKILEKHAKASVLSLPTASPASSLAFQMRLLFGGFPAVSPADSPSCILAESHSTPLTSCQTNG